MRNSVWCVQSRRKRVKNSMKPSTVWTRGKREAFGHDGTKAKFSYLLGRAHIAMNSPSSLPPSPVLPLHHHHQASFCSRVTSCPGVLATCTWHTSPNIKPYGRVESNTKSRTSKKPCKQPKKEKKKIKKIKKSKKQKIKNWKNWENHKK